METNFAKQIIKLIEKLVCESNTHDFIMSKLCEWTKQNILNETEKAEFFELIYRFQIQALNEKKDAYAYAYAYDDARDITMLLYGIALAIKNIK